ncbi:hypothetical protein [Shewanella violacea]|uniref:Uncharacterized protein n=1 Tax=Shewanella violacea (strain JCM 10179 / CIP 106290 / LMG 19151 / DSS12) TaxID=637905 RepID=D4ZEF2_SHEVD|nr:hypothetical protein [Shewanella violacea]BAJ00182.1 hypothetical protein SVI_0211 [Shewanella violacea DSS12]
MLKQMTHLVLIITLVGQFLLTPVMAMPRFLHALTHAHMSEMDSSDTRMKMSMAQAQAQQSSRVTSQVTYSSDLDTSSKVEMAMHHGEKECATLVANMMANNGDILIDCDALCEMMAAGGCISHCASPSGILIHPQFSLLIPESNGKVHTLSWSTQTVDLATFNPPPIWTSLT